MIEHLAVLMNRMFEATVNCGGGGLGGPYWINTEDTYEAISDFIFSFPDNLVVHRLEKED